jgi:hypothetical protein
MHFKGVRYDLHDCVFVRSDVAELHLKHRSSSGCSMMKTVQRKCSAKSKYEKSLNSSGKCVART